MSRIRTATAGTVGLGAIGIAVAASIAPDRFASVVPIDALLRSGAVSAEIVLVVALASVAGSCLLWVSWTAGPDRSSPLPGTRLSSAETEFGSLRATPPERANAGPVVGDEFDETVAEAIAGADDAGSDTARSEIRSLAITVVAHTDDCSASDAANRVDAGEWTDDTVAAAYVGDREAALPLRRRALAWLRPMRTERRRIDRSLRALERRARRAR